MGLSNQESAQLERLKAVLAEQSALPEPFAELAQPGSANARQFGGPSGLRRRYEARIAELERKAAVPARDGVCLACQRFIERPKRGKRCQCGRAISLPIRKVDEMGRA